MTNQVKDDQDLFGLLIDCVKQDDRDKYFSIASIRNDSRLTATNIADVVTSYSVSYNRIHNALSDSKISLSDLKRIKAQVNEAIYLTEYSSSFDLYYPAFTAFFASILAGVIYLDAGGVIPWVKEVLTTTVLAAAAFSFFRRSRKMAKDTRLRRLANYLDVYLDDFDQASLQDNDKAA